MAKIAKIVGIKQINCLREVCNGIAFVVSYTTVCPIGMVFTTVGGYSITP